MLCAIRRHRNNLSFGSGERRPRGVACDAVALEAAPVKSSTRIWGNRRTFFSLLKKKRHWWRSMRCPQRCRHLEIQSWRHATSVLWSLRCTKSPGAGPPPCSRLSADRHSQCSGWRLRDLRLSNLTDWVRKSSIQLQGELLLSFSEKKQH